MSQKRIGMIVPTVDNPFFAGLICRTQEILKEDGYDLLVCSSANDAELEKASFRSLIESGVSGILCVSGLSSLPDGLLPENEPLVWLDRRPKASRPVPFVSNDDAAAMEAAATCLLKKGCRHLLLLPGFLAERQQSPRVIGYRRALEQYGLPYREEYVLERSGSAPTEVETEALVRGILRHDRDIDGILASSDRSAFGAIAALRSVGLYVPEDVKLICFDNSPYASLATPALTTLDRNAGQLAGEACRLLLAQIAGAPPTDTHITVPVSLILRDSTR